MTINLSLKTGLTLKNPLMVASGFAGYGQQSYRPLLDIATFGAIVTNPITLRPRSGAPHPRFVETTGGLILETGLQNPGVKQVIQQYQKRWARLNTPLIVHLPADDSAEISRTARALANLRTRQGEPLCAAIELGIPPETTPHEVYEQIQAVQFDCELPLFLKLPLTQALALLDDIPPEAIDGVVLGLPPIASAYSPSRAWVTGSLYGAGVHGLVMATLTTWVAHSDIPVIAAGGIHSPADVSAYLTAGAIAVQVDSWLFVEPQQVQTLATSYDM